MYTKENMLEMFYAGLAFGVEGHDFCTDDEAANIALAIVESGLTPLVPDAGDSAASSELVQASALSTSQTLSTPQRG